MGRALHKLKPVELPRLAKGSERKLYGDGGGLYLRVAPPNGASWVFRYMLERKPRSMGLGPFPDITLAEARQRAAEARRVKLDGDDPIDARTAHKAAKRQAVAVVPTFKESAEAYIEAHRSGWRNAKHTAQWTATLKNYAYPVFGDLPVSAVDVDLILKVLRPIWETKNDTATKLRQRIEAVLSAAKAKGYRAGENPARWNDNLKFQLPPPGKVAKKVNFSALPYSAAPAFVAALQGQTGMGALALEFAILTAARSGEVREMTWSEVDRQNKVWTISARRMKAQREHRVPLSAAALAVLDKLAERYGTKPAALVFPGENVGRPISDMTMAKAVKTLNNAGDAPRWVDGEGRPVVPHGFRSTFRDWAGDATTYPREMAEAALAHGVEDKVEAAYRRGDALEKRRQMMDDWAAFLTAAPSSATGREITQ